MQIASASRFTETTTTVGRADLPPRLPNVKPRKARQLIASAKAAADPLLVEGTWRTDAQCHTSFEPHAAVARWDGEALTVHASTQAVSALADALAERFSLRRADVRVIADHVGGGFGSKVGLRPETIAAVALARAAGAPRSGWFSTAMRNSL